jgi:hypothetical protein
MLPSEDEGICMYSVWRHINLSLHQASLSLALLAFVGACSNLESILPLKEVKSANQIGKPGPGPGCSIANANPTNCSCPEGTYLDTRNKRCRTDNLSRFSISSPAPSPAALLTPAQARIEGLCDGTARVSATAVLATNGNNALTAAASVTCSNERFILNLNFASSANTRTVNVQVSQAKENSFQQPQPVSLNYIVSDQSLPQGALTLSHPARGDRIEFGQSTMFRGSCHHPSQLMLRIRRSTSGAPAFDQAYTVTCSNLNNGLDADTWSYPVTLPAHGSAYALEATVSPIANSSSPAHQYPVQMGPIDFSAVPTANTRFVMTSPVNDRVFRHGSILQVAGRCDPGMNIRINLSRPVPGGEFVATNNFSNFANAPDSVELRDGAALGETAVLGDDSNKGEATVAAGRNVSLFSTMSSNPTGEGDKGGSFGDKDGVSFGATSVSSTSTDRLGQEGVAAVQRQSNQLANFAEPIGGENTYIPVAARTIRCLSAMDPNGGTFDTAFDLPSYSGALYIEATQDRAPETQQPARQSASVVFEAAPQDIVSSFGVAQPFANQRLELRAFNVVGSCDPNSQITLRLGTVVRNFACEGSAFTHSLTPEASGPLVLEASQTRVAGYTQPASRNIPLVIEAILPSSFALLNPAEGAAVSGAIAFSGTCDFRSSVPAQNQQLVTVSLVEDGPTSQAQVLSQVPVRCGAGPMGSSIGVFSGSLSVDPSWVGNHLIRAYAQRAQGFANPIVISRPIFVGPQEELSRFALRSPVSGESLTSLSLVGDCDVGGTLRATLTQDSGSPSVNGGGFSLVTNPVSCVSDGKFLIQPAIPEGLVGRVDILVTQTRVPNRTQPRVAQIWVQLTRAIAASRFALLRPLAGQEVLARELVASGTCDESSSIQLNYSHSVNESGPWALALSKSQNCVLGAFEHRPELRPELVGFLRVQAEQSPVLGFERPEAAQVDLKLSQTPLQPSRFAVVQPDKDQEVPLAPYLFKGLCDDRSVVTIKAQPESGRPELRDARCNAGEWSSSYEPGQQGRVIFTILQGQVPGFDAPKQVVLNLTFRDRDLPSSIFALTSPEDKAVVRDSVVLKGLCDGGSNLSAVLRDLEKPEASLKKDDFSCSESKTFEHTLSLEGLESGEKLELKVTQSKVEEIREALPAVRNLSRGEALAESRFALINPVQGSEFPANTPIVFSGTCDMAKIATAGSGSGRVTLRAVDSNQENILKDEIMEATCDKGLFAINAQLKEDFTGLVKASVSQTEVDGFKAPETQSIELNVKEMSLEPSLFDMLVFVEGSASGFLTGSVQQSSTFLFKGRCDEPGVEVLVRIERLGSGGSRPTPSTVTQKTADCKSNKEWALVDTESADQPGTLNIRAQQSRQVAGHQVPAVVMGQIRVLARVEPSVFAVRQPSSGQVLRYSSQLNIPVVLTCDAGSSVSVVVRDPAQRNQILAQKELRCPSTKAISDTLSNVSGMISNRLSFEASQTQVAGFERPTAVARDLELVRELADSKLKILAPAVGSSVRLGSALIVKVQCDPGTQMRGTLTQGSGSTTLGKAECSTGGSHEWNFVIKSPPHKAGDAIVQVKADEVEDLIRPGQHEVELNIKNAASTGTPKPGAEGSVAESESGVGTNLKEGAETEANLAEEAAAK